MKEEEKKKRRDNKGVFEKERMKNLTRMIIVIPAIDVYVWLICVSEPCNDPI